MKLKRLLLQTMITLLLLSSSVSGAQLPEWKGDFSRNFEVGGIEVSVARALEMGINPYEILLESINNNLASPFRVIKALYCEGAEGGDIVDGAEKIGISQLAIVEGFKASITECGEVVEDSQAYTPNAVPFSGPPTPNGNNDRSASPATF